MATRKEKCMDEELMEAWAEQYSGLCEIFLKKTGFEGRFDDFKRRHS